MTPSTRSQRGLTIVETAVAIAVVTLGATAAAPGLQQLLDTRRLDAAAGQLAGDLQLARLEAVARQQPLRLAWPAGQSCYVLHTGAAGACRCEGTGEAATCDAGALALRTVRWSAADRVAITSNTASLVFDPLHGTVSPTATLRVTGADGRAIHHVVNVMGRVRSCSPGSAVPGLRAC